MTEGSREVLFRMRSCPPGIVLLMLLLAPQLPWNATILTLETKAVELTLRLQVLEHERDDFDETLHTNP